MLDGRLAARLCRERYCGIGKHAYVWLDTDLPEHIHQFDVSGDKRLSLAMNEAEQLSIERRRRRAVDRDHDTATRGELELLDERHDITRQIGDVVGQSEHSAWWVDGQPVCFDGSHVCDLTLPRARCEPGEHCC